MATENSLTTIWNEILARWGWLGYASAADSIDPAGLYLVHDQIFKRSGLGDNEMTRRWIDRYGLAEDSVDRVRRGAEIDQDNGRWYQDGEAWVDVTSLPYRALAIDPAKFRAAIQTGQQKNVERKTVPLSAGAHDFDMVLEGTDYWDGTSGSSSETLDAIAKQTVEARNFQGEQALAIAGDAGQYTRGEAVPVTPGQQYYMPCHYRPTAGGVIYRIWDKTNGAYIDTSSEFAYTGVGWAQPDRQFTTPDGCFEVQPQFEMSVNGSAADIAGVFGPYNVNSRSFVLPAWMDATYKVRMVRSSYCRGQINGFSDVLGDLSTMEWYGDLVQPDDFDVSVQDRSVNANRIGFKSSQNVLWAMGQKSIPLWVMAERKRSEKEPLDTEASTTSAPFEQVIAYAEHEIALVLQGLQPENPRWRELVASTAIDSAFQLVTRAAETVTPRRSFRMLSI